MTAACQWRPYSANVELTLACNLRCRHCGSSAGRPRPGGELSFEELVACFRQLRDLGGEEVCLLGGEPLLRGDFEALGLAVGDAGLRLVVITNGWLLDAALVRRLGRLGHLSRVGVSLDAFAPEVHDELRGLAGSHARALRALGLLCDAGIEAGAITTVSRGNLGQLEPLRDWLVGRDITWQIQVASLGGARFPAAERLSPGEFYEVGRFIADCRRRHPAAELPVAGSHSLGYCSSALGPTGEHREWHGCGAGLYTLGILSDGRVKGCLSQHDDSFVQGSLRLRSLAALWEDPALFARNRRFRVEQLAGLCRSCAHGARCRAGCSNVAFDSSGDTFDNRFCFHRIERERAAAEEEPT